MEQQRRASHRLEIAVVVEQQLPVSDKAKCRWDIRPQKRYGVPCKNTGEQRHAENDGDEPGHQPAGSPQPKLPQVRAGRPAGAEEVEQEPGDQKPRYYKENVYTEVATRKPGRVEVVDDDSGNPDTPDPVQG